LSFELAPKAVAVISFNFEKEFLKISEHLPDANRGFDIRYSSYFYFLFLFYFILFYFILFYLFYFHSFF